MEYSDLCYNAILSPNSTISLIQRDNLHDTRDWLFETEQFGYKNNIKAISVSKGTFMTFLEEYKGPSRTTWKFLVGDKILWWDMLNKDYYNNLAILDWIGVNWHERTKWCCRMCNP